MKLFDKIFKRKEKVPKRCGACSNFVYNDELVPYGTCKVRKACMFYSNDTACEKFIRKFKDEKK